MSDPVATAHRFYRTAVSRVRWPLLAALVAVVAVFAMHGLGPHHTTASASTSAIGAAALSPMTAMATTMPTHRDDAPPSPSDHDGPSSQTLVALCAVIVLAAASPLSRRFTIHSFPVAAVTKPNEVRATPEPPVPRFLLASS